MKISEFDYALPPERIAQEPLPDRAASRMLVLYRNQQRWEDRHFRELPEFVTAGDCLVLNNSRVFPARLFGKRLAGTEELTGKVEVFLVRPVSEDERTWEALVRPGRKMSIGERVRFADGVEAEVTERGQFGLRHLRFAVSGDVWQAIEQIGHIPLPPYIKRQDQVNDRARYQTVFADRLGSVAAPTAGLHFTPEILEACRERGAQTSEVTLHVGLGTFQTLHAETTEEVKLHGEHFTLPVESWRRIQRAARRIAVGTTSVRTIETAALRGELSGETDLFISPGFHFQVTDALLTNFHLPQSSLLALVCAFAGQEFTLAAYRHAVEAQYRFYSYGDCMLIV